MTSLWLDGAARAPSDEFDEGRHFDEIIVGAGITGLITAVLFARSGRRVAVLEARRIGAVATGNTTAKVSALQGAQLQRVQRHSYGAITRAYVEANLAGREWLLDYAARHGVAVQRRDAVSYATTPDGSRVIEREYRIARSAGLPVRRGTDAGLPFATRRTLTLADQAQLDPMELLTTLAAELRSLGGKLVEGVRVTGARASDPVRLRTTSGEVSADHLVLATGTPVLDRGLYFAKLTPRRSYAASFRVPGELPEGMFLSVDGPTRSLRTASDAGGDLLLVGGNGHVVGRHPSPASQAEELEAWTRWHWPGAELTHRWSAQDYRTPQGVPFVGRLPRGRGRIFLATGYDKWGLTNAAQAALTLHNDILGGDLPWAAVLHRRITTPVAIASGAGAGAAVGVAYLASYARAFRRGMPAQAPEEGQGLIGRRGVRPRAACTVDGEVREQSAICPHLGAVLRWNDLERSWDCPAHGSRFDPAGEVLEGPSTRPVAGATTQS